MPKYILLVLLLLVALLGFQYLLPLASSVEKDKKSCPPLTGRVVWKGEPGYDQGRLVSNYYTSKERFPKVIVYCQNTNDVQNAVRWARCQQVPIRIRSGGHQHEGYSTATDAIVIDVSEMKELKLDTRNKSATIQPGLNNLELYTKLFAEGLTHVGGTCSDVGLSGLVLSGGMGPLLRRVGLTCDSLLAFEMINAKGELIHATKDNEYQDLFWATCGGGGGNFGVITSMQIKVYPATEVTWFNIGWDWDQPVEEVLAAWQEFFGKPDRNWFSHLDVWARRFPSEKLNKKPIKALGMFWGHPDEAKSQLSSLLKIGSPSIEIETVTWAKAIQLIEESTAVYLTDKPEYKSVGAFAMDSLPKQALDLIVGTLDRSPAPLLNVLFFSMGGASAEVDPSATAYYYRKAKFFITYSSQWLDANKDQSHKAELEALRERLLDYTVGDYVGNPDSKLKNFLLAYYGLNAERLKCIKKKYDPENLFQFEQSIPPECNVLLH